MNKASKIKWLVVGSFLALGIGAPVASAVVNAPERTDVVFAAEPVTVPEVTVVGELHPASRVVEGPGSVEIYAVPRKAPKARVARKPARPAHSVACEAWSADMPSAGLCMLP